ncbi:MAG: hypothetical protein J7518_10770 [Nocardioidaceae bacterium]|nr:hypothetical protein [Nocardioidaceae bacterium]
MRTRATSVVALLLALLLGLAPVLTGCSSGPDETKQPGGDEPSSSGGEAGAVTADQLVALLAGAGIATYAEAGAKAPLRTPATGGKARLLRWQVDTMTRQLNALRGYRGTDLDVLAGSRQVPVSVVLAAYVEAARTPGAEASRTLMGDQDFARHAREIVYPDAVLAFFAHDLGAGSGPAAGPASGPGSSSYGGEDCGRLRDFLAEGLGQGAGGVLPTLWSTATEIGTSSASLALPALTGPVQHTVGTAARQLGVLASASSLLNPWAIRITGSPDPAHFSRGGQGTEVVVTAEVGPDVTAGATWPADLTTCAKAAGVTLPAPVGVTGSPVTWTVRPDAVARVTTTDPRIGADGTARLHLTTGTETAADHENGPLLAEPVAVSTSVAALRVPSLPALLTGLFGANPALLPDLVSVQGPVGWVTINHHGPAPGKTPSGSATPTACPSVGVGVLPDGTWTGPITMDVQARGGSAAFTSSPGVGTMTLVVARGQVTRGTWKVGWTSTGHAETAQAAATVDLTASIAGTVRGPVTLPVVAGRWALHGKASITEPVQQTAPIDESGRASTTMTVESTACDAVTGTFLPSFDAKDAAASFTGTARWVGTRKD